MSSLRHVVVLFRIDVFCNVVYAARLAIEQMLKHISADGDWGCINVSHLPPSPCVRFQSYRPKPIINLFLCGGLFEYVLRVDVSGDNLQLAEQTYFPSDRDGCICSRRNTHYNHVIAFSEFSHVYSLFSCRSISIQAYRQLVQQYAKDLNGNAVDPKIARKEAMATFKSHPISASLSGVIPRLIGVFFKRVPKFGFLLGISYALGEVCALESSPAIIRSC